MVFECPPKPKPRNPPAPGLWIGVGEAENPELVPVATVVDLRDRPGSNAGALLESVDVVALALAGVGDDVSDVDVTAEMLAGGVLVAFRDDRRLGFVNSTGVC